jgi:CubicO group peptidase (beta-lactamase class C family)
VTMPKPFHLFLLFQVFSCTLQSQPNKSFADSVRKAYHIPELVYAVVSSDEIYEEQALGIKRINTAIPAALTDKFRIGSNTKAITGFIAALLIKQGKIEWGTKFFDLFPELKTGSDPAHYQMTLLELLSFRTRLYSYSYYYDKPEQKDFTGDESQQRYQFTAWFLKQPPVKDSGTIHFSNLSYVAAGLMLEKASGKSYKQLVRDLGKKLNIDFNFGQPNSLDSLQTWGHNKDLIPEPPGDNYKLNWLLPAGNINVSLPDYIKFIQLQLKGLKGKSDLLTAKEFNFLFSGLPEFAIGWFPDKDKQYHVLYTNTGNPGSFLSRVIVCKESDHAFIVLLNTQTEEANTALDIVSDHLLNEYNIYER